MSEHITINTDVKDYVINQSMTMPSFGDIAGKMTQWVCDTREASFIDAMIQLGWTPPNSLKTDEHTMTPV